MSFQYTNEYYVEPYYVIISITSDGDDDDTVEIGIEDPGVPVIPDVDAPTLGTSEEIIRTFIDQSSSYTISFQCNDGESDPSTCSWSWEFYSPEPEQPNSITITPDGQNLHVHYDGNNPELPIDHIVYINKDYSEAIKLEGSGAFDDIPNVIDSPQIVTVQAKVPNKEIWKFTASYGNDINQQTGDFAITLLANYTLIANKVQEEVNARRN